MKTFLIADDSQDKTRFLLRVLKQAGWDGAAVTASTTDGAKHLIDMHPDIAAAFIDYYMPTENGPAVIRYLRQAIPHAKIALVSSADHDGNSARARSAGADAIVCTSHPHAEEILLNLLAVWKLS